MDPPETSPGTETGGEGRAAAPRPSDPTPPRFPDLDEASLRALVAEAHPLSLDRGDTLFERGAPGDSLYLLLHGRLEEIDEQGTLPLRAGDLVGVLEVLANEPRTSTVRAAQPSQLLHIPLASVERALSERPGLTDELVEAAERQLLRVYLARLLPGFFQSTDEETMRLVTRAFRWLRLPRGHPLYQHGEPGDALYFLVSGRLRADVAGASGKTRPLRQIAPGEALGLAALVTRASHVETVLAIRDSVLHVCERADFERLVEQHPELWRHVSTLLAQRLGQAERGGSPARARRSVALVPLQPWVDMDAASRAFRETLDHRAVLILDRRGMEERLGSNVWNLEDRLGSLRLLPWFEEQEARHDVVVYVAEPSATPWTRRCLDQADRVVLVADADSDPRPGEFERHLERLLAQARPPVHLVLVHPPDRVLPSSTARWLDTRSVHRHHHVRRGRTEDLARVARLVTGNGLGLVLSGGGARGFAHIGVLTVLEELGIAIDAIGGTSSGAGLGSQYAMGNTPAQIRDINWREFVQRKPFSRYTLPVYSLVGREGVDQACRSIYGDVDIADLWIPFFCTSCDLHTGNKVMHLRGPMWKAARASTSLPGIVPPVVDGARLLVDGGVLDNVPEEEMARFCEGRVLAVEVSPGQPVHPGFDYEDMPSPWQVLWSRLNPMARPHQIPRLREILMRTATMANVGQAGRLEDVAELVLRPPVSHYGMLDFPAIDAIIADSIPYSREVLRGWLNERRA